MERESGIIKIIRRGEGRREQEITKRRKSGKGKKRKSDKESVDEEQRE